MRLPAWPCFVDDFFGARLDANDTGRPATPPES